MDGQDSQSMAAGAGATPGMQMLAQAIRGRGRQLGQGHSQALGIAPMTNPAALTPANQGGNAAQPWGPTPPPPPMPNPTAALAQAGLAPASGTPGIGLGTGGPGSLSMMGGGLPMRPPQAPMGATFGLGGR